MLWIDIVLSGQELEGFKNFLKVKNKKCASNIILFNSKYIFFWAKNLFDFLYPSLKNLTTHITINIIYIFFVKNIFENEIGQISHCADDDSVVDGKDVVCRLIHILHNIEDVFQCNFTMPMKNGMNFSLKLHHISFF